MIDPLDVDIGRYACHLETIDLGKFAGLCHRRSGHAGQLLVEAEIVLESHRGHGLVLGLDLQALARLDGLVETFRETAPFHRAAGEFVDDHHLAVLDHVMAVTLEKLVRLQRLVHMVKQADILDVIERALAHRFGRSQQILGMLDTGLGQRYGPPLLVEIVILGNEMGDDLVGDQILVRRRFGRSGNDQGGPRLVDQDGVDLVDDGEMVLALHHVLNPELQVVTKIVETEFVVRSVSDVAAIGRSTLVIGHISGDAANRHSKALIDTAHPARVARGKIVVHRDDMDAFPGKRVQEDGKRRDEGLALTRLHFGNLSLVKRDPTHELDVVMPLPKRALGRLADTGEGLWEQLLEAAAGVEPFAKGRYRAAKIIIADPGDLVLEAIDRSNLSGEFLRRAIGPRPEEVFRQ